MTNEEEKEVFEKMDRQFEVESILLNSIPEFHVIKQWKTYEKFLKKSYELFGLSLSKIKEQNLTKSILITSDEEAKFHLFNFYSCIYCILQYIYEMKSFSKSPERFDALITNWKKETYVRLAIAIRNKYQHGSLMLHVLNYEFRSNAHPEGESFQVKYNLEDETWNKILGGTGNDALNADSKKFLNNLLADKLSSPLEKINMGFIDSFNKIASECDDLFAEVYKVEIEANNDLKKEYDELELWFSNRGMNRLAEDL